jgi:hypothetical protein
MRYGRCLLAQVNSGSMLWRNSDYARSVLARTWQAAFPHFPLYGDQHALTNVLVQMVRQDPAQHGHRVHYYPMCAFNANPNMWVRHSRYMWGDFVVHPAGDRHKTKRLSAYTQFALDGTAPPFWMYFG